MSLNSKLLLAPNLLQICPTVFGILQGIGLHSNDNVPINHGGVRSNFLPIWRGAGERIILNSMRLDTAFTRVLVGFPAGILSAFFTL